MNNNMDLPTAREQLLSQQKYYQNMADALGVAIANLDKTFAPTFQALDDVSQQKAKSDARVAVLEKQLNDSGIQPSVATEIIETL